jgi:phosphatidylglycerophosphate synthase
VTSLAVLAGVVGAAVLSMVVFVLRGAHRDEDASRKGTHLFAGGLDFLVHWFMWAIGPVERAALRSGASPDVFNFGGLLLGLASGVAIARGHLALGGWAIALGGLADVLDGRIARARGVASRYGEFIDSTLDRFVEVFVFLGFCVHLSPFRYGPVLSAAAICGSLLVSYTRARGEAVGVKYTGGLMQRAERLVLTSLACLSDPGAAAALGWRPGALVMGVVALIAIGTFVTAVHRTLWIALQLRRG